ncbi:hypothetical protein [Janthinobacterium sp.]|uniref:hypothetical protein n=1 Tax=Janthinobacterium sp. TaxID=1871054 RepID=UPI0039C87036
MALDKVLGKMVTIELVRENGTLRYFNGYVFEFRFLRTPDPSHGARSNPGAIRLRCGRQSAPARGCGRSADALPLQRSGLARGAHGRHRPDRAVSLRCRAATDGIDQRQGRKLPARVSRGRLAGVGNGLRRQAHAIQLFPGRQPDRHRVRQPAHAAAARRARFVASQDHGGRRGALRLRCAGPPDGRLRPASRTALYPRRAGPVDRRTQRIFSAIPARRRQAAQRPARAGCQLCHDAFL